MVFKFDKDSLASISYLFTNSSLRNILKNEDFSSIDYRVKKHIGINSDYTYKDLMVSLYQILIRSYRTEYFFKNIILNRLLIKKHSLRTTRVFDEFKIGSSIADLVLLNGEVRVFEIKTDLDSFDKVEKQIQDYRKFADKVYIVTSKKLLKKAKDTYQGSNIGIIEYSGMNNLVERQPAQVDKTHFEHEIIFKTLRKDEYISVVESFFGKKFDVPNTQSFSTYLNLAKGIEITEFQKLAFNKLKERKLKCIDFIKKDVPMELRHMCYALDLDKNEYLKLFELLNTKIA